MYCNALVLADALVLSGGTLSTYYFNVHVSRFTLSSNNYSIFNGLFSYLNKRIEPVHILVPEVLVCFKPKLVGPIRPLAIIGEAAPPILVCYSVRSDYLFIKRFYVCLFQGLER